AHRRSQDSFLQFSFSCIWIPLSRSTPSGTTTLDIKKKAPVTKAAGTNQPLVCDRRSEPPPMIAATATRSSATESRPAAAAILLLLRISHELSSEGGMSEL